MADGAEYLELMRGVDGDRTKNKGFHWKYYNPKAVSKLMGHAKEIITMNVYGDNQNIIADGVPEIEAYMKEVLPDPEAEKRFRQELREIVPDVSELLPDTA